MLACAYEACTASDVGGDRHWAGDDDAQIGRGSRTVGCSCSCELVPGLVYSAYEHVLCYLPFIVTISHYYATLYQRFEFIQMPSDVDSMYERGELALVASCNRRTRHLSMLPYNLCMACCYTASTLTACIGSAASISLLDHGTTAHDISSRNWYENDQSSTFTQLNTATCPSHEADEISTCGRTV